MKKISLLLLLLVAFVSTYAQNVEVYNYKFYACYDSQGNKMDSNATGLTVKLRIGLTSTDGQQSICLAQNQTPLQAKLCPQCLCAQLINN